MIEVREPDPIEVNRKSKQKWYKTNTHQPTVKYATYAVGNYAGRYLCIVERPKTERPKNNQYLDNDEYGVDKTVELCYWNSLSHAFQDENNKFVSTPFWTQIAELPEYETIGVPRHRMLEAIEEKEWKLIYKCNESDFFYNSIHTNNLSLHGVSYNDRIFLSIEILDGIRDFMYCVKF